MIPLMRLPLPISGTIVCRTAFITGALSNKDNEDWTDVYVDGVAPDGITVDVEIDDFMQAWHVCLTQDLAEFETEETIEYISQIVASIH